jgi:hypothetical protein
MFPGVHDTGSRRKFPYAGRVQYDPLDSEGTGSFDVGTHLGTKKVAAVYL